MKENKRKKIVDKVENFDKKISKAKDRLDSLEERREIIVAETINETMKENKISLSDFFDLVEKRNKQENTKPEVKPNFTPHNTINGGNAQ